MIHATFDVAMHEEFGILGFRMSNRPHFDPLGGAAVAHDMLEHPPSDDGTFEHELMALGASLYVRDGSSYYAQKGQRIIDPAEIISSDMRDHYYRNGSEYVLRKPPASRPMRYYSWANADIERVWDESRRFLRSELDESEPMPAWLADAHKDRFVGWLRAGFRQAQRRYRADHCSSMCYLFMEVERVADEALKYAYEGQQFRFSVDVKRLRVAVTDLGDAHN